MPFATRKPDASINPANCPQAPFLTECGFTESYEAVLADTFAWLTQMSGTVRAVLLFKLTEIKTDLIPPPLSVDAWAEDDNSPNECNVDDPAYEHLRESTVAAEWVGPVEGFAELWRRSATGEPELSGGRITLLPRPSDGLKKIRIRRADLFGMYAKPVDERATWDIDMEPYLKDLADAVDKTAFQRRVRYLKATQGEDAKAQVQA